MNASLPRRLDTLALLGISGVLAVAFYYQLMRGELPCPLCALQRVGFLVAGVGLMLNLRVGRSPAHYGLVILAALAAGSASLRQIAARLQLSQDRVRDRYHVTLRRLERDLGSLS